MRGVVIAIIQVVVSLVVVAAVMPLLVATVPGMRDSRTGLFTVLAGVAVAFGLLKVIWPRPKRR